MLEEDMRSTGFGLVVAALTLAATAVHAQAPLLGEAEFRDNCAQCHGLDGTGNGTLAGYLTQAVPDLTTLATDNGGVFPVTRVYETIDGTQTVGIHGSREMPVWGLRYSERAEDEMESFTIGFEAQRNAFVRLRILALVEYLSTLQRP
jgi:mono/diheme cytochrome c family protein